MPAERVEDAGIQPAVLEAFRRRDDAAIRAVYRAYGRLVYAIAFRVLGRTDLAEDAVQQTFVRAWQAADRIDVDRDPAPWFVTIARNVAIDIHRYESRRSTRVLEHVAVNDPALVTVAAELETVDTTWRVRNAIDELPPDEATVIRLQHLDGMSHAEISERLGVALGTVKSRSYRAHRHLAARLRHLRPESVT